MGQVHADPHAGCFFIQAGIDDIAGCLFHQGQHGWGGIDLQGTAAHGGCGVGVENGIRGFAHGADTEFFHGIHFSLLDF